MRPRGLSFSSPVWTYVGQASRHRPQWTHARSLRSSAARAPASCVKGSGMKTEHLFLAECETTGREDSNRVELFLHAPHQESRGLRQTPRAELALQLGRRALDDERAARGMCGFAHTPQRLQRLRAAHPCVVED